MGLVISRNWWAVVIRGIVAVLFGLAAFFWPGITLVALVVLFGAFAVIAGIFAIVAAIRGGDQDTSWWVLLLEGIIGVGAGILTFVWPAITALVLLYIIAAWAVATGVLQIIAAIRLRQEIHDEWLLALAGIAAVLFGILVAANPGAGALAVVWLIGAYAILIGILLIALGFRLRAWGESRFGRASPPAGAPA